MTSLRLDGLTWGHDGAAPLFRDVHLHLVPGWTGLVGANGAGKTTLLRLLAGELPCPQRIASPDLRILRLDQRVEAPGPEVETFATCWERGALRLQARLGLADDPLGRWTSLSPGERRRWQVGGARWAEPDVLLLDEPDNHLDVDARAALVQALRGFRGIGLLVAHDRALLDAVTTATARLADGRLDVRPVPATEALAAWQAEAAHHADRHAELARTQQAARRELHAQRARHASADRGRSLRHVDPRDHDARSALRKGAMAKAEARHGAAAARARGRANRAQAALDDHGRPERVRGPLEVELQPVRKAVLATVVPGEVRGGCPLAGPELVLGRSDRVWVRGPNGAGKSTLLRGLLAAVALPDEAVLHLPQELDAVGREAVRQQLLARSPEDRGRALVMLSALGADPKPVLRSPALSPGEARKLALALALAEGRALLVLDEPTHHLDLPARERLAEALAGYPGALVVVTHDVTLGRALTERVWDLAEGCVATNARP